jgi:hypothetical protein
MQLQLELTEKAKRQVLTLWREECKSWHHHLKNAKCEAA